MARDFDGAGDYIDFGHDSGLNIVAGDFSFAGWLYADTLPSYATFVSKRSVTNDGFAFLPKGASANRVYWIVGGTENQVVHTDGFTTGSWQHFGGRRIGTQLDFFKNGVKLVKSSGTDTVAGTTAGSATLRFGEDHATGGSAWDGRQAECALWSGVGLSDAEFAALGTRAFAPSLIRPGSLVFYAPFFGNSSPEPDVRGGRSGTLTNTTKAAHPRVIYPRRRQAFSVAAAAGGSVFAPYYYQEHVARYAG